MNSKLEELDLHDVFFILKKHIALIIIASIVCGLLGFSVSSFVITPQFQAEAKLVVNTTSKSTDAAQIYDAVTLSQKEVDTYAIIMGSDTILNKVIEDLNLDITKDELSKKIHIEGIGTTEVLDLKVKDKSPATAKEIMKEIIKYAPSEIIRTVKAGSVEIVSQPETENKPISPNIPLYTAIAFVIGLIASVLAAFLIEMLNNTFTSDEDVQKYLGFTVVGVIPNIDIKKRGAK